MKFDGRTATRFVVTLVLLLLAGAMLGTSVAQSELRVGVSQIPHNPDPTFDSLSLSQTIYRAMYEGLVSIDGEGREQPMLAESWSVIDDTTWELALRRGVKFHNGEEFTSADVVFTLNRVLDPETSAAWRSRISPISSVVAVDDYTVRIVTSAPFATLLKGLAIVYMLPVSEYSDGIGRNYLAEPVGTGPFRFDSWQGDQYITIERFDDYWGNQPLIDQITYREIPESSSRIAGLRAGELDLIYEVPAESTGVLESNGFNVHSISLGQSMVIVLAGTRGGPLDDRRVRQAINYAIDVELIRETIMQGHGGPLNGQIVGPDGFGHNPDITPYAFDPERARELLAEAGFASGFDVVFESTLNYYQNDREISEAIAAQLAEVGINVELVVLDQSARQAKLFAGTLGPIWQSGPQYMPTMDAEQALGTLHSDSASNILAVPEVDALLAQARMTFDSAERLGILQDLNALVHEEAPMVFMWQVSQLLASSNEVIGLEFYNTWGFNLMTVDVDR